MKPVKWSLPLAALGALLSSVAYGTPLPTVGGPLLEAIAATPAGEWRRVNLNLYRDTWTPPQHRPLMGLSNPSPENIISSWSSFAWDTLRGDLILYGGGHANYAGNDVYRWRSSSMRWERASLPSAITSIYSTSANMAIDGADAAPASAHTYDNNLYLPILDRFLTFGGAITATGGYYARPHDTIVGEYQKTGPYFFDPARADPWKVGGTTGSHVQRVAPFPEIVGGNMWHNRDHFRTIPTHPQPAKHVSGCTAYAEEDGVDIVYVGATSGSGSNPSLYRYSFPDVANPALDAITRVGSWWNGPGGDTTCGYDAARKLFVRTGDNVEPFIFWDLSPTRTTTRDVIVQSNASIAAFLDWMSLRGKLVKRCGLDFDPLDDSFAVWCGGAQVWKLRPPAVNVADGWTIDAQPISGTAAPAEIVAKGVLGKWRYAPGYDVFVALEDSEAGNVWIYKPLHWTAPMLGDAVNWAPTASLLSPVAASRLKVGSTLVLKANAADIDGSIASVEFLADGVRVGVDMAPPYEVSWTVPDTAGQRMLWVRATDNRGAEALSAPLAVEIVDNLAPTVALTSPPAGSRLAFGTPVTLAADASDADGVVTKVEFVVVDALDRQSVVATDTSAPYSFVWTAPQAGIYRLTARATDDAAAVTTSAPVSVTFNVPAGSSRNVALASEGAGATASSTFSAAHPVSAVNNDERRGLGWGNGGGWKDDTENQYPDDVKIEFNGRKTIDRVVVYTLQDAYQNPLEPTDTTTFGSYGLKNFTVEGWNGSGWTVLGTVSNNNLVKRTITFEPFTTDVIRVHVTMGLADFSRIIEVEAWGVDAPSLPPPPTPPTATLSRTSQSFASSGGAGSVGVVVGSQAAWTVVSNDPAFITVTSGGGVGPGTVTFSVAAHQGDTPRTGTITVAGVNFTVLQGAHFDDVSSEHPFHDFIGQLSARGIALGCGEGNFCPEMNVTREQMAIFIERAIGVFTPPVPTGQTFDDVPPGLVGHPFIEDFAQRGITLGCSAAPSLFCPANTVTREQMAIFVMRALGVFDPPTPGVQSFQDVPPSSHAHEFIEAFYARRITSGCAVGYYCPTANVTRGQMAVFLVRAFGL